MMIMVINPSLGQSTTFQGNTIAIVNLRSGPGTSFEVLSVLNTLTSLKFDGRNNSSTWLHAVVAADGRTGWLSYTFVNVEGDVMHLSILNEPSVGTAPTEGENREAPPLVDNVPVSAPAGIVPVVTGHARQIYLHGQELGNHRDVFSKVGDSITASDQFLDPIGHGGAILGEYEYLRPVIDFFSQTSAGDHYSFANTSLAARSGWKSADVLSPRNASSFCNGGEMPLVCEYRLARPSVALIMFGTNDVGYVSSGEFQDNMSQIVQISIDMGVIPVLSTIPNQFHTVGAGRVTEFNDIIRSVAASYDVPVWDYWVAMNALPNSGISSDGVHPSYDVNWGETAVFTPDGLRYGFNMRNLTALMVLDAIWRGALY